MVQVLLPHGKFTVAVSFTSKQAVNSLHANYTSHVVRVLSLVSQFPVSKTFDATASNCMRIILRIGKNLFA
jgi:hypothetical protein